jgi:cytochrome c oxidase subunit 2
MPRRLVVIAALCAVAAAGCGGDDSGSGGGSTSASAPGEQEFNRYACASCHSIDGSEGTGPTFQGLAGKTVQLEGGETVTADRAYLERAIVDPDADVVEGYSGGIMAAATNGFDLSSKPEDVQKLIDYIESVK